MIHLVRHTQPDIDKDRCYGQSNVELREEFLSVDLPMVLKSVEGLKIDKIYSSPLKRCSILATEISKFLKVENLSYNDLLKEMNFGDWELKSWERDIFESQYGKEWFDDFLVLPTPNGESFVDMRRRSREFFSSVDHKNSNIMVVSHSGFIRATLVENGNVDINDAFGYSGVDYGSVTIIDGERL